MDSTTETITDRITDEIAMARHEIGRADGKAGDINKIAIAGLGVVAAIGANSHHLPLPALVLGLIGMGAGVLAVVAVGVVLWPRLGRTVTGYLSHHHRTDDEIIEALAAPATDRELAAQLRYLVAVAMVKFWLVRGALVALVVGLLAVLAGAALLR